MGVDMSFFSCSRVAPLVARLPLAAPGQGWANCSSPAPLCRSFARRWVCERQWGLKKDVDTKNLPFLVRRTPSGNLPVYVQSTQKGDKITRVRRVFGDAEHLAGEVGRLCGEKARLGRGGR